MSPGLCHWPDPARGQRITNNTHCSQQSAYSEVLSLHWFTIVTFTSTSPSTFFTSCLLRALVLKPQSPQNNLEYTELGYHAFHNAR